MAKDSLAIAHRWFKCRDWRPFPFQEDTWRACLAGKSGMLNAPTGSGKTYAAFIGAVLATLERDQVEGAPKQALRILWITPVRALTKDIKRACTAFLHDSKIDWQVAIRTGDTSTSERARIKRKPPEVLITTPESLHLIMASKGYASYFAHLTFIVADEWHELMGSKRAVLLELALSRIKHLVPIQIWGISATIGNMNEAIDVLLGSDAANGNHVFVQANLDKEVHIIPIIPAEMETYPWAGHLGTKLAHELLPIIERSKSTLVFTNTRSQAEIWYQHILEIQPDLAGLIAMHHGSIDRALRDWVEEAIHEGKLKCVVCTSSLDLGVDFRPVETIVQVGSPKGVARFLQRAGRSGHAPGEVSTIYFLPTNGLQLIECAALKRAIARGDIESRMPYVRSFDVLVQYLVTLAVSDGFIPSEVLPEIRSTYSFSSVSEEEWQWAIHFITQGGAALGAYDEFRKVDVLDDGLHQVQSRRIAMRHRLSIGAIVSDPMLKVKFQKGGYLGTIEEWFISRLTPGDTFWFAGRPLELIRIKEMTVQVKMSKKKKGAVPSWQGGRMPLSAMLSENLRVKISEMAEGIFKGAEMEAVRPIAVMQARRSHLPRADEFLIEKIKTRDGYHLYVYPFEGRFVHEGMAALMAYRISKLMPISFSIAFNDYGFELLSDRDIPVAEALKLDLFTTENLTIDIQASINKTEMARRRFRDIAGIAGLVFKGYPGSPQREKHLQSSSQLFFEVFRDYEDHNLLFRQAFDEIMEFQVEEVRLRNTLERIARQKVIVVYPDQPTPFCFPILVDRLREKFSTEKLEDRIKKMTLAVEK